MTATVPQAVVQLRRRFPGARVQVQEGRVREMIQRLLDGGRVSLLVGVVSTLAAVIFGILIGALAGFSGGRLDDLLMRFTEFFQTIPQLAMAVVLVAINRNLASSASISGTSAPSGYFALASSVSRSSTGALSSSRCNKWVWACCFSNCCRRSRIF